MFTGLIQGTGTVHVIRKDADLLEVCIGISVDLAADLELGASVAVDGVCLTVTRVDPTVVDEAEVRVWFDIMDESLRVSNLAERSVGDLVNIERSYHGGEIGGHPISGHVDTTAQVVEVVNTSNNMNVVFELLPQWNKFIFLKGFVAISGASLTISDVNRAQCRFSVWLIPETLRKTNLRLLVPGATVNIEIERSTQVIVETLERLAPQLLLTDTIEPLVSAMNNLLPANTIPLIDNQQKTA